MDRARAELLGVKVATVYETLQTYFASRDVSQFVRDNRICRVILQADGEYRDKPDDLTQVYVASSRGGMIPLSVLATVSYVAGPETLSHFNGFPAVKVNARTLRADGGTTRTYWASLDVSWELDLWGRVRRATEADRAAILSSEAARRAAVLSVVSKVAEGYLLRVSSY